MSYRPRVFDPLDLEIIDRVYTPLALALKHKCPLRGLGMN
jgi:hypothetical protein